jgi:hypothetical protein
MGIPSSLEALVMIYKSAPRHILEDSTRHAQSRLSKCAFVIKAMNLRISIQGNYMIT